MKKAFSLILVLILAIGCTFSVASCGNSEVAGVYELADISGSMTVDGVTQPLSKDLYEYYTMILEEDGTGKVASKGVNTGNTSVEYNIEWEYEDTTLKIYTLTMGIRVAETMTLSNGVITYSVVNQNLGNNSYITMHLTLNKQ